MSKLFIFGHRVGKFILNIKHIKKLKFTSIKQEINAMKMQEVNFQKSQKLLVSRAWSLKQTIIASTALMQPAIEIEWIAIECFE